MNAAFVSYEAAVSDSLMERRIGGSRGSASLSDASDNGTDFDSIAHEGRLMNAQLPAISGHTKQVLKRIYRNIS